jgi:hypothetical protein
VPVTVDSLQRTFGDLAAVGPAIADGVGKIIGRLGNRDDLFGVRGRRKAGKSEHTEKGEPSDGG